jgi:hypothetical protein
MFEGWELVMTKLQPAGQSHLARPVSLLNHTTINFGVTAEELLLKQEDDELVLTIVLVEILHIH